MSPARAYRAGLFVLSFFNGSEAA